jgi:hypothetical protein
VRNKLPKKGAKGPRKQKDFDFRTSHNSFMQNTAIGRDMQNKRARGE